MSPYLALAQTAFQQQFTYRTATLAGLLTNAFFGLLRAYVLVALFDARGGQPTAGYTVQDAVTFTGLAQAMIAYIAMWGWWDLIRSVRFGDVAVHLSQPIHYFAYWGAQDVGRGMAQFLLRGLPLLVVYALVYPITWPPTLWHWLALPLTLLNALLLSFAWRFLVSLSAFWTKDAYGIGRAAWFTMTFLSGFAMPLAFFPDWLQAFIHATPFPAIVNTPIEIFLGLRPAAELPLALGVQLVWLVALYALSQIVLAAGLKRLAIQGG